MRLLILTLVAILACSAPKNELPIAEKDFCSSIHRNDSLSLTAALAPIADSMKTKSGVYMLEDGGGSLVARAWLADYAEKTIDIQYFIFSPDNVGLIACDYLVRAADRGVKVRLLVDDVMVEAGVHEILTLDSHENIDIKIYNPGVNLGKNILSKVKKFSSDFKGANQRMHNKTFIVDGKVCITGGRNIADEYFDYDHEYNFRDRDVLLLGKVNENVEKSFEDFWTSNLSVPVAELVSEEEANYADTTRFDRLHQYACNSDNFWPQVRDRIQDLHKGFEGLQANLVWLDDVHFVSDVPGKNDANGLGGGGVSTDTLINLIKKARRTIDIQSPYLVTSDLGKKLFKEAVDRGVKIRILTNSMASTDNMEAFSGYKRDRKKLLSSGVRIFEFRPDAKERYQVMTGALQEKLNFTPIFGLHAKSMIIDSEIVVVGTFNLDPRSANLNTECVTVIRSKRVASGVLAGMETEFAPENSWETTLTFNPDSVASRSKRVKTWSLKMIPKDIL
ncbi:MAG TPA: phospholipase D family protein [Cyclobacteriaceae bacterium]|nr:phospholipase D family protein [Cyclobacteriaceae bacterium]HMV08728.1 phospholipase D family protein [Cyclobacteriaceae bacterium]HMV90064.1 phospholipase D family protein [Cyclobacteriaceae bacterium]HMW99873.1 phospholipase D family protein [Cyclobacteriaceae bacterium]HMX49264.1 phospholipase D family protein [Cyclobacteriaceae bacterium]